jgi:hypothetical protein
MPYTRFVLVIALVMPVAARTQQTAGKPAPAVAQPEHVHVSSATHDSTEHTANHAAHRLLAQQIAAVREATARYQDVEEARRDGFVLFAGGEAPLMGEHWYRKDRVKDSLALARPSTLQYATIGGERRLVGVAYTVYQRPDEPLPEGFAGDADHWHVHDIPMLARAVSARSPVLRWLVNRRIEHDRIGAGDGRTQLVMVHAWIWLDNPDGMFALRHRALPYLKAGLPAEWAALPDATAEAARGLMLLDSRTCMREIRIADRLTDLSLAQSHALREGCRMATESVDSAREQVPAELPEDAEAQEQIGRTVNGAAAAAWRAWIDVRNATLTAEQLEHYRAIVEHAEVPSGA